MYNANKKEGISIIKRIGITILACFLVIFLTSCPQDESCPTIDSYIIFKILNSDGENLVNVNSEIFHPDSIRLFNENDKEMETHLWTGIGENSFVSHLWVGDSEELLDSHPNGMDTTVYLHIPTLTLDTILVRVMGETINGCVFDLEFYVNGIKKPLYKDTLLFIK